MKADGFFLIPRRKSPVIFELEKQIFNQMSFFVCVPVRFPRMPCTVTAWNDRNTSPFLLTQKAPVFLLPGKCRSGFRWKVKNAADYQAHPLPHGPWSLILLDCVRWPRCSTFFSAAGVLVHFDSGTAQHKCCLIDYILPDQIRQYVLPYA